jgi:cytoskeletal protein CcmA (bactofilin family)
MSVFASGDRGDEPSKQSGRDHGLSIVAGGMRVVGELVTEGVLKIEGTVEGTIRAHREVLVAKGGNVEGDIHAAEAVIGGTVHGSIHAEERVEVQQGAVVEGDISTKKLLVQEGGEVNGQIRMGDVKAPAPAPGNAAPVPSSMGQRSTGPIVRT